MTSRHMNNLFSNPSHHHFHAVHELARVSGVESFWDRTLTNEHLDADSEIPHVSDIDGSGATPSSALDNWEKKKPGMPFIPREVDGSWMLMLEKLKIKKRNLRMPLMKKILSELALSLVLVKTTCEFETRRSPLIMLRQVRSEQRCMQVYIILRYGCLVLTYLTRFA